MSIKEGNRREGLSEIQNQTNSMTSSVDCILNRNIVYQNGTIYFTNKSIIFISSPDKDYSISIDYESIGVHAICHNSDIYSKACVYLQVSDPNIDSNNFECYSPGFSDDMDVLQSGEEEEEFIGVEEVLFAPNDSSQIDTLFNQISLYQSQNENSVENEDDILQTNGEVAFDCNVEELFLRADVL